MMGCRFEQVISESCQIDGLGDIKGLRLIKSSRRGRDADHLAPDADVGIAGGTILVGGQAIAAELEVVVDAALGVGEALRVTGRLEPLHLPLSSPGRLLRHLGAVVQITALPVLDPGQDLALGGGVAAHLVASVVAIRPRPSGQRGG